MTDTNAAPEGADFSEIFADLLEESFQENSSLERTVVKGTVVSVDSDHALIDVGLKSEGRVALKEFAPPGQPAEIAVGDKVEVFVERYEDVNGEVVLSREKARREEAWEKLEEAFEKTERVTGTIFGRVKGGFTVDLSGAVAFLPGSQVDIRPVRDVSPLMGTPQPFMILKMDRSRGNIVVSRRAVLEETRAAERTELVANLKEGQVLQGVVKNITDYGAFVDLGGVDGLLHVTDISWRRINHPSEALQVGQTVQVQVVRFNPETQRISLGMKQLEADPWDDVELQVSGHLTLHRPRDQHHRLRCIRGAGAGHRRPGPCLRDELDQKERASRARSCRRARKWTSWFSTSIRPSAGFHWASSRPRKIRGTSSRPASRRARKSTAKFATSPSLACLSACRATSTAWSTLSDISWEKSGEEALKASPRVTWSR